MLVIRQMCESDIDAARQIDAAAFRTWWRGTSGQTTELPRRTRTNVMACLEKDPDGCFVAEEDGRAVGVIFSRTWGGVGWFGTFAIMPQYQGQGIGKKLVAASLAYLRQEPDRVVGLETMPESPYNLGLYLQLGFQARSPTFLLTKSLGRHAPGDASPRLWSQGDARLREQWLGDLQGATGAIYPGLDYSKEVLATARHDQGETLVLTNNSRAVGMSTVWLAGSREDGDEERAGVHVLALHPAFTNEDTFQLLVTASEKLAYDHGKRTLTIAANARHAWALEQLLKWDYRVERMIVRMVLGGTDKGLSTDRAVDLSRWAG